MGLYACRKCFEDFRLSSGGEDDVREKHAAPPDAPAMNVCAICHELYGTRDMTMTGWVRWLKQTQPDDGNTLAAQLLAHVHREIEKLGGINKVDSRFRLTEMMIGMKVYYDPKNPGPFAVTVDRIAKNRESNIDEAVRQSRLFAAAAGLSDGKIRMMWTYGIDFMLRTWTLYSIRLAPKYYPNPEIFMLQVRPNGIGVDAWTSGANNEPVILPGRNMLEVVEEIKEWELK